MASRTKININTASVDDIIKYFKGTGTIGEKRARQIVEYRKDKGSINSVEDLVAQRIITRPIADKIRDKVEFKISSRGATRKNTKTKGKNRTNSKKVSRKKKPVKEESVLEDNSSKETEAQNVFSQEFVSYAKAQFSAIPKFKDITDNQVIEALKNPLTYAKIDAGFAKVKIAEEKKVVAAFMNERLGITESMALDYLKDENNFNMWKASYDKYLDYKHNRIIEFYVSESKSLGTEMTFDEAKAELEKHPYIYELVSDAFDKDCQSHPEKHDIKADYLCIAHNMTKDEMRNYFTNAKQKLGEAGYEQFKQGLLDNYEKTRQEMIKFMFGEFPDVDQSQMYENLDSYDMFAMLSFMSKTPQYKDKKEQIEAPSNQVQQDLQQDFTQTISEPSYEEEQLQSFSKTPEGKKGKKND